MSTRRQFVVAVIALALLLSSACKKKKPHLPPQAQAPTIPVTLPDKISETKPPPPPPNPPKQTAEKSAAKPKTQTRHRRKPPQSVPTTPSATGSSNGTVAAARPPANPAVTESPDTAIGAEVSNAQVTQQQQTTTQLLDATEKNLKTLPSTLNHDQEGMVAQVKTYVAQSHSATAEKDFERAYNLALKARLLSDALVKK